MRPSEVDLAVGDLDHDLGPHPVRAAPVERLGRGVERTVGDGERRQAAAHAGQLGHREARPDPAGVAQHPVAGPVVGADEQRPEAALAVARAPAPSADDPFVVPADLDLHPLPAAGARHVGGVAPLGDDALETLGVDGRQQVLAVFVHARHVDAGGQVLADLFEQAPPLVPRPVDQVVTAEAQQVEHDVGDGDLCRPAGGVHRGRDVHPVLQPLEAGPAGVVEGDDLAVEEGVEGRQRRSEGGQLGERDGHLAARRAPGPHAVRRDVGEHADAVPLDLVDPAVARGQWAAGGLHGGDRHGAQPRRPSRLGVRRSPRVGIWWSSTSSTAGRQAARQLAVAAEAAPRRSGERAGGAVVGPGRSARRRRGGRGSTRVSGERGCVVSWTSWSTTPLGCGSPIP